MSLLGQLEKIEKHEESVAMPTARNYSSGEETKLKDEKTLMYAQHSRNTKLANAQ
jgi:hypothetical protein